MEWEVSTLQAGRVAETEPTLSPAFDLRMVRRHPLSLNSHVILLPIPMSRRWTTWALWTRLNIIVRPCNRMI